MWNEALEKTFNLKSCIHYNIIFMITLKKCSTHWGTVEHLSTTKFSADQPESGNRFPGLSQLSAAAGNFCLVPTRPLSTFQTKRVHHQFRVSPPPSAFCLICPKYPHHCMPGLVSGNPDTDIWNYMYTSIIQYKNIPLSYLGTNEAKSIAGKIWLILHV